jgi:hypothetical protein
MPSTTPPVVASVVPVVASVVVVVGSSVVEPDDVDGSLVVEPELEVSPAVPVDVDPLVVAPFVVDPLVVASAVVDDSSPVVAPVAPSSPEQAARSVHSATALRIAGEHIFFRISLVMELPIQDARARVNLCATPLHVTDDRSLTRLAHDVLGHRSAR